MKKYLRRVVIIIVLGRQPSRRPLPETSPQSPAPGSRLRARPVAGSAMSRSINCGRRRTMAWRCSRTRSNSRQANLTAPRGLDQDRQVRVRGVHRAGGRLGPRTGAGRRETASDRARDGRQERLLLPDADGTRASADPARGLRRADQEMVRHGRQRRATLPRRGSRYTRALDGPDVHVQHLVPRLPREPVVHQLRSEDRHVSHHVGRAGHQL